MGENKVEIEVTADTAQAVRGTTALEKNIRALADTLDGELKVQALATADALAQMGTKKEAIDGFKGLLAETRKLGTAMDEASQKVDKLGADLPRASAATKALAAAQTAAAGEVQAAKQVLDEQRAALVKLQADYKAGTVSSGDYKEASAQLKVTVAELRDNLTQKKTALTTTNQAVNASVLAEKELAKEYASAISGAGQLSAALGANSRELDKSRAALKAVGVETNGLAETERKLKTETAAVTSESQKLVPVLAGAGKGLAQMGQAGDAAAAGLGKTRQGAQSVNEQLNLAKTQLAAFISAQIGLGAVKSVAATADEYTNLQARIKLATGEGQAFADAFDQVVAIAQRTSSSLEQTGTLFTRVAEAGKSAGLTTEAAIAQSLRLTETINQAVQLSGGSAESSNAAVTQLIQGLQSGVLRGEEFNSVMEQAPRLARALADGLGVTTGELRKMADAGALSADTVINALKGQSDVLKNEFATLPPTIGRALENLSTSWSLYIGQTDKATGASASAASAIKLLSDNLAAVAGYLIDAGQAAAGLAAVRLAQTFMGIGAAVTAASVATAGNTVATQSNTVAQQANALAVRNTGAAATEASAGVGRFTALLSTLRTFTLIGIVTNFKDIGTAIGEGAARLLGYKDRTEELARAEKLQAEIAADNLAMRERGEAMTKAAIDKQFELTVAAKASLAEFEKLTKEGTSTAEAISKIGKDFDLANVPGIKNASSVLDKLAADGKLTAGQFQKAWADALKGVDLGVFEVQARAALAGTTREAERLAQVLDATLREAVKRTGLDFDVISGGMGKAARSAINDTDAISRGLEGLKKQGVDTGQVLAASIGKSINAADSKPAIDAVRAQIESLRSVLGDKITDGFLDQAKIKANELADALDKAKPGVNSLREAMIVLGVTSDQTLKTTAKTSQEAYELMRQSGTASARELGAAFVKSANDAIAANNGIAPSWVQAQAGARGYELLVDAAGKTTVRAMGEGKKGVDDLSASFRSAGDAADDMARRVAAAREERLKGQAATDGTGAFALRAKQRAGTLSAADLQTAEAVLAAAEFNKRMLEQNATAYSIEGTRSVLEELNSAKMILEEVKRKAGAAQAGAGAGGGVAPSAANSTYLVKLDFGNGKVQNVNVASANDAQVLIGALQQAKSAAGY